ncbi:hypothetical protein H4F47_11120 [Pectobacterium brasiliense]|uniref:hypothetical protein n=1 Tax=Pectobacterium brasiliense TaxID=180957 RepID=UPI001968ABEC|nr:hypothetical protein [Pectobacterium brasiliense]MBN3043464.1 hypothetical protein [Pectobacterium brasiliense]
MKVIDMIRNLSQRNSVVNSSDVSVIFSELDKSNYRIGELQKDNETLRAMMREVEIQRDALVAENAALKGLGDKLAEMSNGLMSSGGGYHDTGAITYQQAALDAAMDALDEIKTPATDAAISAIAAKAVDEFAKFYAEESQYLEPELMECAKVYANKLRGGGV